MNDYLNYASSFFIIQYHSNFYVFCVIFMCLCNHLLSIGDFIAPEFKRFENILPYKIIHKCSC